MIMKEEKFQNTQVGQSKEIIELNERLDAILTAELVGDPETAKEIADSVKSFYDLSLQYRERAQKLAAEHGIDLAETGWPKGRLPEGSEEFGFRIDRYLYNADKYKKRAEYYSELLHGDFKSLEHEKELVKAAGGSLLTHEPVEYAKRMSAIKSDIFLVCLDNLLTKALESGKDLTAELVGEEALAAMEIAGKIKSPRRM